MSDPVDLDRIERGVAKYLDAMNRDYTPSYTPDLGSHVDPDDVLAMVKELRAARAEIERLEKEVETVERLYNPPGPY